MARSAIVMASVALIGTGVVGVAALAPEHLPAQVSVYLPARQAQVTPEQLQAITKRLDGLVWDVEKVRQTQTEQAATIGSLATAQQQASTRIATAMELAASKSQNDAAQQSAIGDLRQTSAEMKRQIAELEQAVVGMRQTVGAALTTPTAAPAKPAGQRPGHR